MGWIRLFYHHLIYWVIGTTPESHHAGLASCWFDLKRYRRCIVECERLLEYQDSVPTRGMIAFCHAQLGRWRAAADTYRPIASIETQPLFALGLAEAELRVGNVREAQDLVVSVEVCHPSPERHLADAIDYLKSQLAGGEE